MDVHRQTASDYSCTSALTGQQFLHSVKDNKKAASQSYKLHIVFIPLQPQKSKDNSMPYRLNIEKVNHKNKIHYFHAWGAVIQI